MVPESPGPPKVIFLNLFILLKTPNNYFLHLPDLVKGHFKKQRKFGKIKNWEFWKAVQMRNPSDKLRELWNKKYLRYNNNLQTDQKINRVLLQEVIGFWAYRKTSHKIFFLLLRHVADDFSSTMSHWLNDHLERKRKREEEHLAGESSSIH